MVKPLLLCANKACSNPLPPDYSYKNCQSCIQTNRKRSHHVYDGKISYKDRCDTRIPRNGSDSEYYQIRQSRFGGRPCKRYNKCGNRLAVDFPYKSCDSCREEDRMRTRARRAAHAIRVLNNAADGMRVEKLTETEEGFGTEEAEVGDDSELGNNSGEENAETRIKDLEHELVQVKQEGETKLRVAVEQLNRANRKIEKLLKQHVQDDGTQSPVIENGISLKEENERFRMQLKEQKSQLSTLIQNNFAEHTQLNILNRLLLQTKDDFAKHSISGSVVLETFDNLSSQLRELADKRLDNIPVSLLEAISNKRKERDGGGSKMLAGPSKRQKHE